MIPDTPLYGSAAVPAAGPPGVPPRMNLRSCVSFRCSFTSWTRPGTAGTPLVRRKPDHRTLTKLPPPQPLPELSRSCGNPGPGSRLIRLPGKGKAVFVGDTHGDFDATASIFRLYFKPGYILVFLGDYVDRGEESLENLEFLLRKKAEAPGQVFLLAGNHEGYCSVPFSPADFWESLAPKEYEYFSEICKLLSFAAVTQNGVFAVHGATPDITSLEEIDTVQLCSEHWMQLTWGDFIEQPGEFLGDQTGRPAYGEDYFVRAGILPGTCYIMLHLAPGPWLPMSAL